MIQLRCYTGTENLKDSYKVREEVFVKEQGFTEEFDNIDKTCTHVVAYDFDNSIATGRVFVNRDGNYTLGRICVLKTYRKKGIGRQIIESLEKVAMEKGAKELHLGSQLQAKEFYEKLGYISIGELYYEEGCPHVHMVKKVL